MSYKTLIKNWHAKAAEEDYFSKFVFEYLAFIAHLKTQLYTSDLKDRQAIQMLKQDESIRSRYLSKIQSLQSLKRDWEHIKQELDRTPIGNASNDLNSVEEIEWWNCSREHLNQMTQTEQDKRKGVIYSPDDWENMVEFWHSIRNNLFHGAKNPENPRDQFAVKYGYRTLKELMGMPINEAN